MLDFSVVTAADRNGALFYKKAFDAAMKGKQRKSDD